MHAELNRRHFLCLGTLCALGAGSLFISQAAMSAGGRAVPSATTWLSHADFSSTNLQLALASLDASDPVPEDPRLRLDIPDLIEDGARVPVSIDCDLEGVDGIALLATANPFPLVATIRIPPDTLPRLSLRIKLQASGKVIALARTPEGFRSASRNLDVISGGCT